MLSGLPLLETVRAALTGDGLLAGFMGGTANVFALGAPDNQALPYITLSDRKSTRLNSSHGYISYAVFCLKKKKNKKQQQQKKQQKKKKK